MLRYFVKQYIQGGDGPNNYVIQFGLDYQIAIDIGSVGSATGAIDWVTVYKSMLGVFEPCFVRRLDQEMTHDCQKDPKTINQNFNGCAYRATFLNRNLIILLSHLTFSWAELVSNLDCITVTTFYQSDKRSLPWLMSITIIEFP